MTSITVSDLRKKAEKTAVSKMHFTLTMWDFDKPSYKEWIDLLEDALTFQMQEIATHRNYLHDVGEDALTSTVVIGLRNLGLEATHSMVNGNCDVTVRFDDYLWLGEAKIFKGVTPVWHGYLQLTQRYGTALPNQNSGGMLLYCVKDSAAALLTEWRATLSAQLAHCNARDSNHPLIFRSSDVVSSSGLTIEVTHHAFPLLHNPVEDTSKLSDEALMAGRLAKRTRRAVTAPRQTPKP